MARGNQRKNPHALGSVNHPLFLSGQLELHLECFVIADFGEAMDPRAPKLFGDSAALPHGTCKQQIPRDPGKALRVVAKLSSSC